MGRGDAWIPAFAGMTSPAATSLVVGDGDELGVLLGAPLEGQEVVVAAASAGEAATERRARLVDRAAALLGVEEAAHAPEDLVRLAPHGVLAAPALDRELGLGLAEGDPKVLGQPFHIALVERDQRIGAAIAGTFLAVVHGETPHTSGRIAIPQPVSTNSRGMQRLARVSLQRSSGSAKPRSTRLPARARASYLPSTLRACSTTASAIAACPSAEGWKAPE